VEPFFIYFVRPTPQIAPTYGRFGDAALDLRWLPAPTSTPDSGRTLKLLPQHTVALETNLQLNLPSHLMGLVLSRSGLAAKYGVFVANSPGLIDSGYKGEIKVILHNGGTELVNFKPGDKVAQLLVLPKPTAVGLVYQSAEDRGSGGFGSTG
jgi:dUTP pyrophosphatase